MSSSHWRLTDSETIRLFDLRGKLHGYYRRRTGLADVEAMVMVTVTEAGARFERRSSLQQFVFAIAKHKVADFSRSQRRRRDRGQIVLEGEGTGEVELMPDQGAGPETLLDHARRLDALDAALATVPEVYREVVRLWLAGRDNFQIAAELGLAYNTVRSRLSRGLAALRSAYGGAA